MPAGQDHCVRAALGAIGTVLILVCCACSANDTTEERPNTPSPAEVRWGESVIEWLHEYDQTLERTVRHVDVALKTRLRKRQAAFDNLKVADLCPENYRAAVGEPPTLRLRLINEHVLDACQHFVQGADILSTFVADLGPEWDRKEFLINVRRWRDEWSRARQLVVRAGAQLARLAPPNARNLPTRTGPSAQSRIDPALGRVAARLAGDPVEVRCWSMREWTQLLGATERWLKERITPDTVGFVLFGEKRINLAGEICAALDPERPVTVKAATAIGALTHEAMHVRGVSDETAATCQGLRRIPAAAALLGYTPSERRALADLYRRVVLPSLPPAYRTKRC